MNNFARNSTIFIRKGVRLRSLSYLLSAVATPDKNEMANMKLTFLVKNEPTELKIRPRSDRI